MSVPQTERQIVAKMVKPIESDTLSYSDENINIAFLFSVGHISFALKNKTEKTIKIIWDESALVIDGMSQKVIHKEVSYINKSQLQPPTIIPAGASSSDLIKPVENVNYSNVVNSWYTEPIFGKTNTVYDVAILFSMSIGGAPKEYYFGFKATNSVLPLNNDFTTMKLEKEYRNGYSLKSSKSVSNTWDLVHALLKEKGFELQEDKSRYYILAQNNKLKNAYCAEIGKGQLSSYDKYVVVTRCYSRSTDSFAPVTDLKASWQVQVMEEKGSAVVLVRMDNYSINRRTQNEILCPDAEVRSTGLLEKQIAEVVR